MLAKEKSQATNFHVNKFLCIKLIGNYFRNEAFMKTYTDRQELIAEIKNRLEKYDAEFENIPEDKRDLRIDGVDKTPSENLAYQLGWVTLLLEWDAQEKQGLTVMTPAPGYKWNQLGSLYQEFYQKYGQYSLKEQRNMLQGLTNDLYRWIETLSEEELFQPQMRKWATTKAMWPVWKWIHINTVAPFTNFRTQIRKWKKLAQL